VLCEQFGACVDQAGSISGSSPAVDDEVAAIEPEQFAGFGKPVAAGRVIDAREQGRRRRVR